jgi:hypothetical protein
LTHPRQGASLEAVDKQPGQSGNPSGRPPGTLARDLAGLDTDEASARLVQALNEPRNAVQAAIALLDRGWGKPKEQVESTNLNYDAGGIDKPPRPETLDEWLERRRTELDAQLNDETPKH